MSMHRFSWQPMAIQLNEAGKPEYIRVFTRVPEYDRRGKPLDSYDVLIQTVSLHDSFLNPRSPLCADNTNFIRLNVVGNGQLSFKIKTYNRLPVLDALGKVVKDGLIISDVENWFGNGFKDKFDTVNEDGRKKFVVFDTRFWKTYTEQELLSFAKNDKTKDFICNLDYSALDKGLSPSTNTLTFVV